MLIHRLGLELARCATPPDAENPTMTKSIQIEPDGRITATDGHVMIRLRAHAEQPDLFTEMELPELAIALEHPVLVPSDVALSFSAACKRKRKKHEPDVVVVAADDDGPATLASADGRTKRRFEVKQIDGAFPSVDRLKPSGEPRATVILSLDLLRTLVCTLLKCKAGSIRLTIHDPNTLIPFQSLAFLDDITLAQIEGCVMPMSEADTVPTKPEKAEKKPRAGKKKPDAGDVRPE